MTVRPVKWTKLTDHRSDWVEAYVAEVSALGETFTIGYAFLTEHDGWGYTHSSENGEYKGRSSLIVAQLKVELRWASLLVDQPARKAPAEERAEAYKAMLIKLIGAGDVSGYQDQEIVDVLLKLGDVEGLDPEWVNRTHMQAHDQVRLALALGAPVT